MIDNRLFDGLDTVDTIRREFERVALAREEIFANITASSKYLDSLLSGITRQHSEMVAQFTAIRWPQLDTAEQFRQLAQSGAAGF